MQYTGADWIESSLKIEMSDFGRQVADLLGQWYAGIYHGSWESFRKADWKSDLWISIVHYGPLSTFDFDNLTRLVVLCHDRMIRCEIVGCGPKYMRLNFSPRKNRDGHTYERHPEIETAVKAIRERYDPAPAGGEARP